MNINQKTIIFHIIGWEHLEAETPYIFHAKADSIHLGQPAREYVSERDE